MPEEIKGLNCMTKICFEDENCEEKTEEIMKCFKDYGELDKRTMWKTDSKGYYWMLVVHYKKSKSCKDALAKKEEITIKFSSTIYRIFKHNILTKTPLIKLDLKDAKSLDVKILNAMRNFGIDEMVKLESRQEKISMRWNKMFAVILVLPNEDYEKDETVKSSWKNLPEDLKKYAKFAIPTSYTPNFDDALEDGRKVLHAEAKLVGNPVRDPAILSVPYDRSWLMRIINKREADLWKSGKTNSEKYKVFLYSELEICDFCKDAIYQSIYINLVKTGKTGAATKHVIGHYFTGDDKDVLLSKAINDMGPKVFLIPPDERLVEEMENLSVREQE